MRRSYFLPAAALLAALSIALPAFAQVSITIDSKQRFQTIEGWGHGGGIFFNLNYVVPQPWRDSINYQYLDYITNELGLTGSRVWEVGPRIDGTGMDNGDCDSIDWTRFQARPIDSMIAKYTVYFRNRVESEGYTTSLYSSPTYPTAATLFKPWVLNHPGERAQQIWADALWWKAWGIDINYAVIDNEPSGAFTAQILADDIKALGPCLKKLGLKTMSQYAEAVAPQTDWNFMTPVLGDSELWKYVGRISYHNYGTADPYRSQLRDLALSHGITTAQTEMGNPTIDDLFNDLTLGGVSYWEIAFSGSSTLVPSQGNMSWTPSSTYFRLRQLLHYVRPGDVRIGAVSGDSMVRVVSFMQNSAPTIIILNNRGAKTATLTGLTPLGYGVSQSASGTTAFQELGVQQVGFDSMLTVNLGGAGTVTTIYPHSNANHPPAIMSWGATPGFVAAPANSATLTAKANDAEKDPLTYAWTVADQPAGASASLSNAATPTATANGLSTPGIYVFRIDVSDGTSTVSRKVYLQVFDSTPPPMMGQAGFRFAAPYGLVFTDPPDTTHASVELPTSSATLQVGIGDYQKSDFTGRGKWTLVRQPPGASAKLDTTIYIFISIRAQVSNMTVPGDYVFQCNITNPGHPDLVAHTICTVHPASSGPVINSIAAIPPAISLPRDSTALVASTLDPEGQLLRHWWAIKSVPAGANPTFTHQGLPNTAVTGLTIPGTYTFTIRTFDDLHMATKDVTVTVAQSTGSVADSPHVPSQLADSPFANPGLSIFPNPCHGTATISYTVKKAGMVKIEVFDEDGRRLQIISDGFEPTGLRRRNIDLSQKLAGHNTVRVTLPDAILTAPVAIVEHN